MSSNEDCKISVDKDDVPRIMNDDSQDEDDENHEGQNAQMHAAN